MNKRKLEQTIDALRGSAKGIASAMDEEGISSQEVYSILLTIADRFESITTKSASKPSTN